jgi:glycosyltransferase involved in cell wall biosynthesis
MAKKTIAEVVFVYVGELEYRGRLRKEIRSLRDAGAACRLVIGNVSGKPVDPALHYFPIEEHPVPLFNGKARFFLRLFPFAWTCGRKIARSGCDVVFCLGIYAVLAGVVAKWFRPGLRLVFDNNELYLESFQNRLKRAIWKPLQKMAIRSSDFIIHAERNRMDYFRRVYGGNDKTQVVIENFPQYYPSMNRRADTAVPLPVIYLGALGDDRYTEELIEAGRMMHGLINLDLVGFGEPEVMKILHQRYGSRPAENVRILPPVPYDHIPSLLERYLIGIAFYKNTNLNNYFCAPNKVYDYIMSGMAVIANDYPGLRSVLEDNRLGVCVRDITPSSIESAVSRIVSEARWNNITEETRRRYSWESQEAILRDICGIGS